MANILMLLQSGKSWDSSNIGLNFTPAPRNSIFLTLNSGGVIGWEQKTGVGYWPETPVLL